MNEITRDEILAAADQLRQEDEIQVKKLPRHDILNLKLVLEKLADSKPLQQEIEDIKSSIDRIHRILAVLEERTEFLEDNHPDGNASSKSRTSIRELKRRVYKLDRKGSAYVAIFGNQEDAKVP